MTDSGKYISHYFEIAYRDFAHSRHTLRGGFRLTYRDRSRIEEAAIQKKLRFPLAVNLLEDCKHSQWALHPPSVYRKPTVMIAA